MVDIFDRFTKYNLFSFSLSLSPSGWVSGFLISLFIGQSLENVTNPTLSTIFLSIFLISWRVSMIWLRWWNHVLQWNTWSLAAAVSHGLEEGTVCVMSYNNKICNINFNSTNLCYTDFIFFSVIFSRRFIRWNKVGVLQYAILRPILTVIAL